MTQDNLPPQEVVNPENNKKKNRLPRKRLILTVVLTVVIVVSIAGIGFAQKMKDLRDNGPIFFMMEKISKELKLDDKQKAEMDKIHEEIKAKMESNKQSRQNDMADFENLFKQNSISKDELKLLVQKHEQKREEMRDFYMDEFIKFHAILTPEQRQLAIDKMHEMKNKGDGFFKHGNKMHPPDDGFPPPEDK